MGDLLRNSGSELLTDVRGACSRCTPSLTTGMRLWQRLSSLPPTFQEWNTSLQSNKETPMLRANPQTKTLARMLSGNRMMQWWTGWGQKMFHWHGSIRQLCVCEGPERAAHLSAKAAKLLFCSLVALCLPVTLCREKQGTKKIKLNPPQCLQKAALCTDCYPDISPSCVAVQSCDCQWQKQKGS